MAARMNYSPSAIGRTLRSGKTEAIGLVLTPSRRQFVDTYFLPLLSGLDQKFKETGKSLFVTVASGDKQAIPLLEKMIRGQRVDALIVTRIRVNDPRVKFLQDSQFPFVTLGRSRDEPRYPFVDFDHRVGASLACEHLLGLGHRRIGLINTPAEVHSSQKRSEGFHECLQKAKINTPPGYELYGDYTPQSGSRLMQKLLRTLPPPTAVICGNDEMAIGAMEAVRAGGKEVGFDVSIIGCDDIPMAEIVSPPLTTFHTSFLELGVRLAELANARIEGRPNMSSLYTPKLIVRRSTGTANARCVSLSQLSSRTIW